MAARTMQQPASLVSLQVVSIIGMGLVAVALWLALRELRLANGEVRRIWRFPAVAVALVFSFVICGWGFLQQ
jgi:hypothetical protein